jgi:glycosyltransferase involved in cell wall biosynthesis
VGLEPGVADGGGAARIAVAQVGPDPAGPGGMSAVIAALVSSPLAARYRFDVIPTYRDSHPIRRLLLFACSLLALVRWCGTPGPRIVHVHMAARGSMYRKACVVVVARLMQRPVVLHLHAGPGDLTEFIERLGRPRRLVLRKTFRLATCVLSVSASGAETLRRLLVDLDVTVVPNAPPSVSSAARSNGAAPAGAATVLFLGGFDDPAKGGAVLLEALPGLLATAPGANVVLAGPGEPPSRLPERASWRGWLDSSQRDAALDGADVFVMPSLSEGMPMALLEAMARGLPIVATRVGGVPELLTDGVDALLVEPGEAAELAAAVAELVGDPERRSALGSATAERARRLAEEDVFGKLDRVYLRALR